MAASPLKGFSAGPRNPSPESPGPAIGGLLGNTSRTPAPPVTGRWRRFAGGVCVECPHTRLGCAETWPAGRPSRMIVRSVRMFVHGSAWPTAMAPSKRGARSSETPI